jgi:hypothetical protein
MIDGCTIFSAVHVTFIILLILRKSKKKKPFEFSNMAEYLASIYGTEKDK